jgi:hypothetical protein
MKRHLWIIVWILASHATSVSLCRAQEFAYRSTVRDSVTQKGLPDVYIFAGTDSTGGVWSGADGTFRLNMRKGETVRFRKAGYRWLNLQVTETAAQPPEMVPSGKSDSFDPFDEVEVNGKLLPKKDCADMNSDYFISVSVSETEDKKYRLVIQTK